MRTDRQTESQMRMIAILAINHWNAKQREAPATPRYSSSLYSSQTPTAAHSDWMPVTSLWSHDLSTSASAPPRSSLIRRLLAASSRDIQKLTINHFTAPYGRTSEVLCTWTCQVCYVVVCWPGFEHVISWSSLNCCSTSPPHGWRQTKERYLLYQSNTHTPLRILPYENKCVKVTRQHMHHVVSLVHYTAL